MLKEAIEPNRITTKSIHNQAAAPAGKREAEAIRAVLFRCEGKGAGEIVMPRKFPIALDQRQLKRPDR